MTPIVDAKAAAADATAPQSATSKVPADKDFGRGWLIRQRRHDMTWHDHLIMLLHLGASIEHALMVQYLYSAYSLGGAQVPEDPPKYRLIVQEWQETILSVARKEMGHLLSVQNILTLMGAGINLNRENFPWDIEYYPFPFNLEQFDIGCLACYIYAEMPESEEFPEKEAMTALATRHAMHNGLQKGVQLHSVGEIYTDIIALFQKRDFKGHYYIPDSAFQEQSVHVQASWDDWGRGYRPDPRPLDAEGNRIEPSGGVAHSGTSKAYVMVAQVATRTEALQSLEAISAQGEGPHRTEKDAEPSHFKRFIKIYRDIQDVFDIDFDKLLKEEGKDAISKVVLPWSPSRKVANNPTTVKPIDDASGQNRVQAQQIAGRRFASSKSEIEVREKQSYISSCHTRDWAMLFNLRYRMLLTLLSHAFRLARDCPPEVPSQRAVLMHRVFGEMYNLKTIAGILVQLPLTDDPSDKRFAGPPFEMPFNLRLPPDEADTWCLHLDLFKSSKGICKQILEHEPRTENAEYVEVLLDLDARTGESIKRILDGMGSTERY